MGLWSISMHLSIWSMPEMDAKGAGVSVVAPFNSVAAMGYRVLLINVDLPEPDTPVTQVSRPTGIFRVTSHRLLPRAPASTSCRFGLLAVRFAGISIFLVPFR